MITERAFNSVAPLLAGADGCLRHRLVPTLDSSDVYLLEVVWRDLAAHTQGFEPTNAHARFMAPLEQTLSGEPIVVHISAEGQMCRLLLMLLPAPASCA